jgi:hypothetical protein
MSDVDVPAEGPAVLLSDKSCFRNRQWPDPEDHELPDRG